jgi:hypothetical protein
MSSTLSHSAAPRRLIIVPAFNEGDVVGQVVSDLRGAVPDCDILVIDDGSTDGTAARVPAFARVISLPFNQGIGAAMQTGYCFAAMHGYDVAVQVDGDGQHPAHEVPRLLEHLEGSGADMVVGSRFLETRGYVAGRGRMVAIRWLRLLLRILTGKRYTDSTSGFRAVNRTLIRAFAHWYPEDYPEPEVILLLHRAGFRVEEFPVDMSPRRSGQTSIPFSKGLFYVLKVTAALLLALLRRPWPKEEVNLS